MTASEAGALPARQAGVMGWPVAHSRSPRLHGYWLKHYGIDGSYVHMPVEPKDLPAALANLAGAGFAGVNLTIPHKEAALALVDEVSPQAARIGAINTIFVRDGRLIGTAVAVTFSHGKNSLLVLCPGGQYPAGQMGPGQPQQGYGQQPQQFQQDQYSQPYALAVVEGQGVRSFYGGDTPTGYGSSGPYQLPNQAPNQAPYSSGTQSQYGQPQQHPQQQYL